eukprot:TRINITY_DN900_c0_g1_i1.p1 TRINITY_DN900_c0_g1~~TRINITY_DN900_c0_g1_i1.p1  ORF type:complete len:207 (-),score=37.53 TRINITY_DN900_c0_g1_i1:65-685(-)
MMSKGLLIIAALLIISAVAQPSLRWPEKWRSSRNKVEISTRKLLSFATYYVDATKTAIRMDIETCTNDAGQLIGLCSYYLLANNIYYAIPSQSVCCLAVVGVGPTPPDWIEKLNHTYLGTTTYLSEAVYHFTFEDEGTHDYYLRVSDPRFPFVQAGGGSANEYYSSELVDTFDPNTFKLPGNSCMTKCPSSIGNALKNIDHTILQK